VKYLGNYLSAIHTNDSTDLTFKIFFSVPRLLSLGLIICFFFMFELGGQWLGTGVSQPAVLGDKIKPCLFPAKKLETRKTHRRNGSHLVQTTAGLS
jgi:hypothetical protein